MYLEKREKKNKLWGIVREKSLQTRGVMKKLPGGGGKRHQNTGERG